MLLTQVALRKEIVPEVPSLVSASAAAPSQAEPWDSSPEGAVAADPLPWGQHTLAQSIEILRRMGKKITEKYEGLG